MRLNGKALGLAFGVLWGVTVFGGTLVVLAVGGGEHLQLLSRFYLGYSVSAVGSIVGLVYGFVDGLADGG